MPNVEILARNVRALMAAKNIRQQALSEKIERAQSTVSGLLKGKPGESNPTVETVELLANFFRVPVWALFVPGISVELLQSRELAELLQRFAVLDDRGRAMLLHVAEGQAALTKIDDPQDLAAAS